MIARNNNTIGEAPGASWWIYRLCSNPQGIIEVDTSFEPRNTNKNYSREVALPDDLRQDGVLFIHPVYPGESVGNLITRHLAGAENSTYDRLPSLSLRGAVPSERRL